MIENIGIYGNRFCFEDLYHWIDDKVRNPSNRMDKNCCITIIGAPGIGKTYSVEKICEALDIHIKRIDSTNCRSIKEISDMFIKMASTNLEEILMQKTRKKIIFIDEFDIMIQMDRNIPSAIYQLIDTQSSGKRSLPYIPVVIACNDNIEKKLGDIRRLCKTIHLKPPTEADVILMLRSYTQINNIKIPMDVILNISEGSSGNIQHALQMLQYQLLIENSMANEKKQTLDSMPDINILYNNPSLKIAYHIFNEDIWMNPLRFHENLPKEMDMRKGLKQKKQKIYSNILRCMLNWDMMLSHDMSHTDIAMTYLSYIPCYMLSELERKKNAKDASMNEFTKTLSQMSLQCKLKRHTYKDNFPWEHIGNYCYTIKNRKIKKFSDVDTDIQPYGSI